MHTSQRVKVAVVIPTRNGADYLADAVRSVQRQTLPASEILVIDDASSDASAEIAERMNCRCVRLPESRGVAASRNLGISLASAEYIAFLDQDDRWRPNKLLDQISYMAQHPDVEFTLTELLHFLDCKTQSAPTWARDASFCQSVPGFTASTLVVRRAAFLKYGVFVSERVSSDLHWIARAQKLKAPFEMLPQSNVERRIHDANVSRDPDLRRRFLDVARSKQLHPARSA